jgi:hypothetical protein
VRSRDQGDLGTADPAALAERLAELARRRSLELNLDDIVSGPAGRSREHAGKRS